jgi:hypothetical protein
MEKIWGIQMNKSHELTESSENLKEKNKSVYILMKKS